MLHLRKQIGNKIMHVKRIRIRRTTKRRKAKKEKVIVEEQAGNKMKKK